MCHRMSGYRLQHSSRNGKRMLSNCFSRKPVLPSSGRLEAGSLLDSAGHREELVDLRGFEEIEDTGRYAGGDEPDALVLAPDKVTDYKPKAAGVHVGNFSEIEDVDRWCGSGRLGFEYIAQGDGAQGGIHVPCGKWTGEPENDRIGGRVLPTLYGEGGAVPDLILHFGHQVFLNGDGATCLARPKSAARWRLTARLHGTNRIVTVRERKGKAKLAALARSIQS